MRRMRMLVAVGWLLAWPALASAECAWVMWLENITGGKHTLTALAAFPTYQPCVQAARKSAERQLEGKESFLPTWRTELREWDSGTYRVSIGPPGKEALSFFRCFPDTVRPQ